MTDSIFLPFIPLTTHCKINILNKHILKTITKWKSNIYIFASSATSRAIIHLLTLDSIEIF